MERTGCCRSAIAERGKTEDWIRLESAVPSWHTEFGNANQVYQGESACYITAESHERSVDN